MRSARSRTVTWWPACWTGRRSRPAGPDPTTAIFLPVRMAGGSGSIQPSSQPRSVMAHLVVFDGHGRAWMPTMQELRRERAARPVKFGEVIGSVEAVQGFAPEPAIKEVVPFGYEVVDRAARSGAAYMTAPWQKGGAAVHAAGGPVSRNSSLVLKAEWNSFQSLHALRRGPVGRGGRARIP